MYLFPINCLMYFNTHRIFLYLHIFFWLDLIPTRLLYFLPPSVYFRFLLKRRIYLKKYRFAGTNSCDNHYEKVSESVGPSAVLRRFVPRFLFFWFVSKLIATFFHIRKQVIQQELASNNALLIFLLTQKAHCFFSLFAMKESGMALLNIN